MERRHALQLLGATLAVTAARSAVAAPRCGRYPQEDVWRFDVLRQGAIIGAHVFTFAHRGPQEGGDFVVEVAIDIAVELLGLTLFRFTHRAEEVWRDGRLRRLASDTDDDGTPWRVRYDRQDGVLRGRVNGEPAAAPGDILAASLWHPETASAGRLLDTVDGRVKPVAVQLLTPAPAGHFRLTGGIEREVWRDAGCALARVSFPARDGSRITLRRR